MHPSSTDSSRSASRPTSGPTPLHTARKDSLKTIRAVCLDIDDTLSTQGKLTSEAYSALWQLKEAGFIVVPITGRPAGWCDHFARFWPVDAIIGENGAFSFFMKDGIRKRIDTLERTHSPAELKHRLQVLSERIKDQFPDARWASDQAYREYDLAVDICEDVKPWDQDQVISLLEYAKKQGAHAKLSSIHVNIWFGDYDKFTGFQYWLSEGAPGCPVPAPSLDEWIYIGDSPNDEPLFEKFSYSVGVANLKKYLSQLTHRPTWITDDESGAGFTELTRTLIQSRT